MGAIASKSNESNSKKEPSLASSATPKLSKILPFDPRSPSEHIDRTPIAVTKTPSADKTLSQDATLHAVTSQILFDPRSPSSEVSRTPIVVEETQKPQKSVPLRPSRLAELQNAPTTFNMSKTDPRSPTDKVPRTPIEEKLKDENSAMKREVKDSSNIQNAPPEKMNNGSKFPYERDRQPLTVIENENVPQNTSDASSHSVEEEFCKNETALLKKLGSENHIKSDTTFVENI